MLCWSTLLHDKPTRAYCINFSAKISKFSGITPKIDIDGSDGYDQKENLSSSQ